VSAKATFDFRYAGMEVMKLPNPLQTLDT
jgi:hypothetical protein